MTPKYNINKARLAAIREEKKVTKKTMAERLDMTENGYKYKEDNATFNLDQLAIFAETVGMNFSDLMAELDGNKVNENSPEYLRSRSFSSMKNPFQFAEALFERREELDRLFRTLELRQK